MIKLTMHSVEQIVAGKVSKSFIDSDRASYSRIIQIKGEYGEIEILMFAGTKEEGIAIIDKEGMSLPTLDPKIGIPSGENVAEASPDDNKWTRLYKKFKSALNVNVAQLKGER